MTVACCEEGVLVRRLGCYGETKAFRMDAPGETRTLGFVSYDPCTQRAVTALTVTEGDQCP
jgi:hypothetical protein